MKERIIISMTTWSKRIYNIPVVLDTIFTQSLPPDLVVINLAYDEEIPKEVQNYINNHPIEINRVPDTKVYKKLIPTLKKYPNDCIIVIDDDWLYPQEMIADFMEMHHLHPDKPISGNKQIHFGLQCHCGCSTLIKASFFGDYLDMIDDDIISNCPSSDIVYTYFANKAGHPYLRTKGTYFINMIPYNDTESYSAISISPHKFNNSFNYLVKRFGPLDDVAKYYIEDPVIANLICANNKWRLHDAYSKGVLNGEQEIYRTTSYKIGNSITQPFAYLIQFLKKHINN